MFSLQLMQMLMRWGCTTWMHGDKMMLCDIMMRHGADCPRLEKDFASMAMRSAMLLVVKMGPRGTMCTGFCHHLR